MLIDDDRLERALKKLAQTDGDAAALHAAVERAEFRLKAIKDAIFLRSEGSVAERSAIAGTHPEYTSATDAYCDALAKHDRVKNERAREVIVIECWRSMSSARTKGIVT